MSRLAACALALVASGCATIAPPPAKQEWPERRAELQALAQWGLDGRVALAAGQEGFSGGLDWRQWGEVADIALRGPMGGAATLIHVDEGGYVVTDRRGVTYRDAEAQRFIEKNLRLAVPLPIREMRYWLVGAPMPGAPHSETLGEGARLASLDQSGWRVEYGGYATVGELALPERIEITAGDVRLRVVVANWRLGS
jgi:outer membrane lipoprotein LolB